MNDNPSESIGIIIGSLFFWLRTRGVSPIILGRVRSIFLNAFFLFSLEIWPGYVTAVDEYEGGLQLQLDVSHRVLRTETVLNNLNDIMRAAKLRGAQGDFKTDVEKALIGKYADTP